MTIKVTAVDKVPQVFDILLEPLDLAPELGDILIDLGDL